MILLTIWSIFGLLSTCILFAHLQRRFNKIRKQTYYTDCWFSIIISVFGPVSFLLVIVFCNSGLLVPFSPKSKREAFK